MTLSALSQTVTISALRWWGGGNKLRLSHELRTRGTAQRHRASAIRRRQPNRRTECIRLASSTTNAVRLEKTSSRFDAASQLGRILAARLCGATSIHAVLQCFLLRLGPHKQSRGPFYGSRRKSSKPSGRSQCRLKSPTGLRFVDCAGISIGARRAQAWGFHGRRPGG